MTSLIYKIDGNHINLKFITVVGPLVGAHFTISFVGDSTPAGVSFSTSEDAKNAHEHLIEIWKRVTHADS